MAKKKKLSAEEKAAKAAEKAAKEEEKRRKAEERARREEEARLAREAEDREFEREEAERVAAEDATLAPTREESAGFHARRDAALALAQRDARDKHEWDRTLRCVATPDPRDGVAFDAWVKDVHSVPPLPFEPHAFELMETCEAVAGECETYRAFMAEDGDVAAVEALQRRRRVARGLAEIVADKATARCLDRANEHQDEETGYVGYVADRFDGSREWCAVWANYVKNPRRKTIDFPESAGAFAAELPKQVLSAAVAMRARRTAVDAHSELCANELMAVSGAGILAVDLLSLPPLATTTKGGWTVKPRSPLTDAIERVRYPIPRPDDDDDDASTAAATPAVRISHAIPPTLALVDPRPRVAWWDESSKTWTEEGVSDVDVEHVDANTRRLSFSTIVLERFALVQSRVAMFPYRSWHVRPAPTGGSNAGGAGDSSRNVIVSVETNCPALGDTPVEFEVGDGWARLANADDLPAPTFVALREMRDVRLPPKALLAELSRRGVHLTPEDRDAQYLAVGAGSNEGSNEDGSNEDGSPNEDGERTGNGMATKDLANERAACEDVGIIAPGYFVHSSRWCARPPFGTGDSVVRVAEVRDVHLTDAVDVRKIFANEHDPREWRPDRYDWGMRTLLRNERGCVFVDVKDSYDSLDDSLRVIVRDGRGERVGAKAVRARMIEGRSSADGAIPAPTYYPDARSALISLGSRRGGRERIDDASFTATATTAETLRLLRVFSFTREREPEPEVSEPEPEPEVSEPELERERTSTSPEPEPELDEDGNPVEKPSRGDEDGDVDPDAEAAEERAKDLV